MKRNSALSTCTAVRNTSLVYQTTVGSVHQTYTILRVSDNVTVCKAWQRISLDSWSDVKTLSSLNTIISADEYICAMKRATTSLTTIDLTEFFSYDGSVEEDICRIISKITLLLLVSCNFYRGYNGIDSIIPQC